jgi:hypothetical protein
LRIEAIRQFPDERRMRDPSLCELTVYDEDGVSIGEYFLSQEERTLSYPDYVS